MKNTNAEVLEAFGKILMKDVRDSTANGQCKILAGSAKAYISIELQKKLESLSNEQKEGVRALVIDSIDGALNNFLWMIEQSEKFDLIAYKGKKTISLRDISDGLCGDYWNFVDHYSHYQRLEELIGYDYDKAKELREKAFVENLAVLFPESPSAAKREFVKILNNNQKYEELKTKAHTLPSEILRSLIEMTLSQSSFHEKECKELLEILERKGK